MANKISNFRLFLHKISDKLGSEDLEDLKFLCSDILTKAKLERITSAKELFVAIGEVSEGEDGQLDLIKQLLTGARRLDLAKEVDEQQSKSGTFTQFLNCLRLESTISSKTYVSYDKKAATCIC